MMLENVNTIGARSTFNAALSGGYCTEYQTIYDQFSSAPSDDDANAQNTFVKALVDAGVWADLDRLYIFASHASGADSLLDWIHPTGTAATIVNAPTWTQYQGYKGNITTMYINSNFSLETATKFHYAVSQGDAGASMGFYIRDNVVNLNDRDIGVDTATGTAWQHYFQSGIDHRGHIHGNGFISDAVAEQRGMNTINASDDRAFPNYYDEVYHNAGLVLRDSDSMLSDTDGEVYISAVNFNGVPIAWSERQMSMAFVGDYLNSTKQTAFYNAFQALMTYYGTQV